MINLDLFSNSAIETLPWQPILGKIGKMTFIRQAGHSKTGKNMAVPIQKYSVAIL